MKYFLSFITIIFICNAHAQAPPFPNGVANTYTLTENNGYNGFIYSCIAYGKDGTLYTCDYSGNIEIHGNNYSIKQENKNTIGQTNLFKIINPNEVWAFSLKSVTIIKYNKIEKIIPIPQHVINIIEHKNIVYIFCANNNKIETYSFTNGKVNLLAISDIPFAFGNGGMCEATDHSIWLFNTSNGISVLYKFNTTTNKLTPVKNLTNLYYIPAIKDENNFYALDKNRKSYWLKNNKLIKVPFKIGSVTDNSLNFYIGNNNNILYKYKSSNYSTASYDTSLNITFNTPFIYDNDITGNFKNQTGHINLGVTSNKPILISNYIKKYPTLFDGNDAANIFTLREDGLRRIWAGSYKNKIAIINKDKIKNLKPADYKITNGGSFLNNKMYLIGEGLGGLLQYDMQGNAKKLTSNTGFYTFVSNNKKDFYFSTTSLLGLWKTTTKSLEKLNPVWNKIDSTKGNSINNILTIAEDTIGRIWCGHPRNGIAIYNPATDKAQSWVIDKNETPFGAMSSTIDNKGTIWLGGRQGLWFYNDYSKAASPQNCFKINHPLLNTAKILTALSIYDKWLVIAAYDKILLFDLKSFYAHKKIIVRYLNPYETNFTSFTEQNTMLTAKDSSVWFSTGDMLYHWDIKNWLTLETPKVNTTVVAIGNNISDTLLENKTQLFKPNFNSFDIVLHYVSKDNMLRYTSTALIKDGDTILMAEPSLISNFSFKNIESGYYTFYVDVFEMDGTTSHFKYKIIIKKFIWQQWWFWLFIALLCIGIFTYLLNLKKKKQLAEQIAKRKDAELETVKAAQAKKIANLQLVTLSSQFRPHFILNALNTIGAQMDDKPEAESVLSRLGESINLIFSHAQQQKIVHSFANEWLLVANIIHIHKLMYLKNIQTNLPANDVLKLYNNIKVPLGILQIPIENALLHGLSNREHGPWLLTITLQENNDFITIEITDNGVGRKKSATLSNYTKHGTGTKNLSEIISIINASNPNKIMVSYKDDVFADNGVSFGTTVIITLPKLLDYANQ